MTLANRYEGHESNGGGDLNLNPESFYYSLVYIEKTNSAAKEFSNLVNNTRVDNSLVTELGYNFAMAKSAGIGAANNIESLFKRMKATKESLVKMDSSLNGLFSSIDSQINLVDLLNFGDMTSETDIQLYWEYLKTVYYGAEGKKENELSEVEKYALQAYENSGYATYDKYVELQKEIEAFQSEYDAITSEYYMSCDGWSYNPELTKRYTDAISKMSQMKSQTKEYEKELKEKGLMEYSGWEQMGMAIGESFEKKGEFFKDLFSGNFGELWGDVCDCVTSDFSTGVMVTEKATAGVLKIGEWVLDGTQMLNSALATPFAWVGDKVFGTNAVGEIWDQTMSDVAVDYVGEAEKWFYTQTGVGSWVNDKSLLKWDSAGANLIKKGTIKVAEIAAAVVVTYFTGGTAAPFLAAGIGFMEGLGEGGENQFSAVDENGNYTGRNLKGLGLATLSGVGKAAEWYGYGKAGTAAIKGFQAVKEVGLSNVKTAVKTGIKDFDKEVASTLFKKNGKTIFKKAGVAMLKDADTWVDTGTGVVRFVTHGLESGEYDWGELALDVGFALGGNLVGHYGSALFDYSTQTKRQLDAIKRLYDDGTDAAAKKYNNFFKAFREHGNMHSAFVAEYADNLVRELSNVDVGETLLGAITHDIGMKGGYMKLKDGRVVDIDTMVAHLLDSDPDEAYKLGFLKASGKEGQAFSGLSDDVWNALSDDAQDTWRKKAFETLSDARKSEILAKWGTDAADVLTRKNHPLNSAVYVLANSKEIIPDGADPYTVALLAMSHSKSTSGISDFANPSQWEECIDKLAEVSNTYGANNNLGVLFPPDEVKRLKSMISNSDDFARLQKEALCIRDGDAMSRLVMAFDASNKPIGQVMQPGGYQVLSNAKPRGSNFDLPIASLDDELAGVTDMLYSADGTPIEPIGNTVSKRIHAGEANVDFDTVYDGSNYKAKAIVKTASANEYPRSTFAAIEERLGEVRTYTNCADRTFEIVLPKDAEGKALGNYYQEAINKYATTMMTEYDKLLVDKKISQSSYDSTKKFFEEGIKLVFSD